MDPGMERGGGDTGVAPSPFPIKKNQIDIDCANQKQMLKKEKKEM